MPERVCLACTLAVDCSTRRCVADFEAVAPTEKYKTKQKKKWKNGKNTHRNKCTKERKIERKSKTDGKIENERALSLSLSFERKSVSAKSALSELNYFYGGERGVGLKCYKNC